VASADVPQEEKIKTAGLETCAPVEKSRQKPVHQRRRRKIVFSQQLIPVMVFHFNKFLFEFI
jgi:hypothetical protein